MTTTSLGHGVFSHLNQARWDSLVFGPCDPFLGTELLKHACQTMKSCLRLVWIVEYTCSGKPGGDPILRATSSLQHAIGKNKIVQQLVQMLHFNWLFSPKFHQSYGAGIVETPRILEACNPHCSPSIPGGSGGVEDRSSLSRTSKQIM